MTDHPSIVLAPFANERMREWPLANFRRLIDLGLADGRRFAVVGALAQRPLADELVRSYPADRVENLCGTLSWSEVEEVLVSAGIVVANNSGIAHLAAARGVRLLCVFSAKHSWIEWMPRGVHVTSLVRPPACSPCEATFCPNGLTCLADITADLVYEECADQLGGRRAPVQTPVRTLGR